MFFPDEATPLKTSSEGSPSFLLQVSSGLWDWGSGRLWVPRCCWATAAPAPPPPSEAAPGLLPPRSSGLLPTPAELVQEGSVFAMSCGMSSLMSQRLILLLLRLKLGSPSPHQTFQPLPPHPTEGQLSSLRSQHPAALSFPVPQLPPAAPSLLRPGPQDLFISSPWGSHLPPAPSTPPHTPLPGQCGGRSRSEVLIGLGAPTLPFLGCSFFRILLCTVAGSSFGLSPELQPQPPFESWCCAGRTRVPESPSVLAPVPLHCLPFPTVPTALPCACVLCHLGPPSLPCLVSSLVIVSTARAGS